MIRRVIILSVLAVPLLAPTPARAGGWWDYIDLPNQYLVQGHAVEAGASISFATIEAAERARRTERYFAYLIAGLNRDIVERAMGRPEPGRWWSIEGARAVPVGSITLRGWDANLARATTRIVVPGTLDPGWYALMFCDAGCLKPLGSIIPSKVRVVASSLEASLAHRLDVLERQLQERIHAIQRLRETVREAVNEGADDDGDIGSLRARVAVLEARLDRATEPTPARAASEDEPVPWSTIAGWFLAGVATTGLVAALAWRRRRSRYPAGGGEPPPSLDDELVALTRPEDGSARTGARTGP